MNSPLYFNFQRPLHLMLLAAVCLLTIPLSAAMADLPALHVTGSQFIDQNGNRVLLPGVGLSCAPDLVNSGLPSGTAQIAYSPAYSGTNYATLLNYLESVAQLVSTRTPLYGTSHGWGTRVIRLGMSPGWFDYNPNDPPDMGYNASPDGQYFNQGQLAAFVDNVVAPFCAYCQNLGLYVIIDTGYTSNVNDYLLSSSNPSQGALYQLWDYISNPADDNDPYNPNKPHAALRASNVIYELFNEPVYIGQYNTYNLINDDQQAAWNSYQPLIQSVVNNIRNVDSQDNVCLVGGLFYASLLQGAVSNPVNGGNIGYVVHSYPNGAGFSSLGGPNSGNTPWQIMQNLETSYNGIAAQAPVVVTETNWFNYNDPNEQFRYAAAGNSPTYMGTSDAFGNVLLTWVDEHAQGVTCWTYGEMLDPVFQISASSLDPDPSDYGQTYFKWLWDAYDSENRGATSFPPVADGWYFLASDVDTNMVLNEQGDQVTYPNPSPCMLYPQTYSDNEQWHAIYQNNYGSDGPNAFRYEITTDVNQGWALGQQYNSDLGFAQVDVDPWNDQGDAQLWDLYSQGSDSYMLENEAFYQYGIYVMDDYNGSTQANNPIDIWQENGGTNQKWQFQPTVPLH